MTISLFNNSGIDQIVNIGANSVRISEGESEYIKDIENDKVNNTTEQTENQPKELYMEKFGRDLTKLAQENRRYTMAHMILPKAPTAADSVGVAIPAKIEARILVISKNGRMIPLRARNFSFQFTLSSEGIGGPSSGFMKHLIAI